MSASIRFISGGRKGDIVTVETGRILRLGREPDCELRLDEPNVSRYHASLRLDGEALVVANLGSTNGIYVNGVRRDHAELRQWDVVVVGGSAFRVEGVAASTPASPAPDLAHGASYRELLQCLLAMQRILGEDSDRMIERSLETLFLALPASRLSLFSVGDTGDPVQGFTTTRDGAASAHMSHAFARKVLAAGRAVLLSEQEASAGDWGQTLQEQHVRTILGVPVTLAGRTVAVLLCDNIANPGELDQHHVPILEFAGKALEHVFQRDELRRLATKQAASDHEQLAAKRVQAQIFTKDPAAIPGPGRWTALYQPAFDLGGDFYDFNVDATGVTWVVADVSGKGVPAALVVSMLKAFCKTLYPQRLSPVQLLLALNDLFRDELSLGMFFTAVVVRVEGDRLSWCNVGHPPAIIVHADGRIEELEPTPGMLGMWPSDALLRRAQEHHAPFVPGDRLCLYTDGLVEAMDPDHLLFGIEGLRRALAAGRDQTLDRALSGLLDAVTVHRRAAPLEDDITIVLGDR